VHCVKNIRQLRTVMGDLLDERFYADLEADQQRLATMSMLVPPQMLNTMVPDRTPDTESFYADPIRRYMIPVASDRRADWPSHPHATRDSLHEHDMWVAEGLTHRYPTKVLAELLSTCPQYCGHCTRMDLVGNSTPGGRQAAADVEAGGPVRSAPGLPQGAPRRPRRRRVRAVTWPTCRGGSSRRT
jgi:lysine 2,3-aminomutase